MTDPNRLPPGIALAAVVPPSYSPLLSNPRLASEPPYERLVLISSRVHNPERVAASVLPSVAYIVYDWKNFTLQELLRWVGGSGSREGEASWVGGRGFREGEGATVGGRARVDCCIRARRDGGRGEGCCRGLAPTLC